MDWIGRWFGTKKRRSALTTVADLESHRDQTRRELLGMAVRDTLKRNGIPPHWVVAETHTAPTPSRARGMHLRLVMREWQPGLLDYTVSLQRAIQARLSRLDPLSPAWVAGVSWAFDIPEGTACPALPARGWAERARSGAAARPLDAKAVLHDAMRDKPAPAHRQEPVGDFRPTQPMLRD